MKVTEELLNEMKEKDENFSDGLILPDGDYIRSQKGIFMECGTPAADRGRNLENDPGRGFPLVLADRENRLRSDRL